MSFPLLSTEITDHEAGFQSRKDQPSQQESVYETLAAIMEQVSLLSQTVAASATQIQQIVDSSANGHTSLISNNYYYYYGTSGSPGLPAPLPPTPELQADDYRAILFSPQAQRIKLALMQHNLIDENWQHTQLTGAELSLLAKAIADRLNIKDVWQVFGPLWNRKPSTMRSCFNRALEQKKSLEFQDRLIKILGPISIR